jgi:DNA-binding Lrp family transcriptional regulator
MGRPQVSQPPLPVEYVRDALQVRQDGQLIWRDRPREHFPCRPDDAARFNNQRAGEPAGFAGPDGKLMVRVQFEARTRRIAASRIAWMLATGAPPKGTVRARNGDDRDLRPENLILTPRGPKPFGDGGRASSLHQRAGANTKLLQAMAANPDAPIAQLSALTGSSEPCVCTRLQRLSEQGLCHGPMCVPGRAWALSQAGRALAAAALPVLDNRDRDLLAALALTGMGTLKLARRVGTCPLTVKRRLYSLIERGLAFADPRRFYGITDQGRRALGTTNPPRPAPWLGPEQISAASAKDVRQRLTHPNDDRSAEFRSKVASMGAQAGVASARLRRTGIGQSATREFDRMAG